MVEANPGTMAIAGSTGLTWDPSNPGHWKGTWCGRPISVGTTERLLASTYVGPRGPVGLVVRMDAPASLAPTRLRARDSSLAFDTIGGTHRIRRLRALARHYSDQRIRIEVSDTGEASVTVPNGPVSVHALDRLALLVASAPYALRREDTE